MVNRITKQNFMATFHKQGSIASWLVKPLKAGSLLIHSRRMKDRVNLGATWWFSTRKPQESSPLTTRLLKIQFNCSY